MHTRKKILRLYESDATGVLYFANQFRMAQEFFEEFLEAAGLPLGGYLERGDYLMPVVHAEADFLGPITVGDELEMNLQLLKLGSSSFTLGCIFKKRESVVGTTSIVHVVISRSTWSSIPIPSSLQAALNILKPLFQEEVGKA